MGLKTLLNLSVFGVAVIAVVGCQNPEKNVRPIGSTGTGNPSIARNPNPPPANFPTGQSIGGNSTYTPSGGAPTYTPTGGSPTYTPSGGSPTYTPTGGSPAYNPNAGSSGIPSGGGFAPLSNSGAASRTLTTPYPPTGTGGLPASSSPYSGGVSAQPSGGAIPGNPSPFAGDRQPAVQIAPLPNFPGN